MKNTTIRNFGISIVAASVSAYFVSRLKAGKVRCCQDPATCLCELNREMLHSIVTAVRSIPE
jgi:hypothetical protein